jgi:hypothetical protein
MARKRKQDKAAEAAADVNLNGSSADVNGSPADAEQAGAQESSGGGAGAGRLVLLLLVATVAALVLSEDLRSKLLDLLFGAEEEFDYSSTTMPATDAPVGAAAS